MKTQLWWAWWVPRHLGSSRDELTWDIPTAGADIDLVTATREDQMLQTVRSWVESGKAPPWPDCAGLHRNYVAGAYKSET